MENTKKRGRPRTHNARGIPHAVRFNYDEECKLQEILNMTGQNLSDYIRDLVRKDWYDKMT